MKVRIKCSLSHPILTKNIAQKAKLLLTTLGLVNTELSIVLVNDEEMKRLNQQYRHKNVPTNVLSFGMHEGNLQGINPDLLGDIVISLETAQREAVECGFSLEEMIDFYLIHGLLNLLGCYSDNPEHERKMRQLWRV
ncbi:MAG TPA: rRNA maturation RNase YbeY, partial [Candidatus Desulfofervidus auxilii]|nr:rRNA maturation RNase YbeY [Candidatus Desulfofervidus auxilii]